MSRHNDRDRSRDRQGYRGRSQSPPDQNQRRKRTHHRSSQQPSQKGEGKRVKFNDVPDIKIFRKQDEPNTKGLTQAQLEQYMKKIEAEKGSNSFNNQNLERMKHFDAINQQNSIKEQKQKQKILNEKLQSVKEEISFYTPLPLKLKNMNPPPGKQSKQREQLQKRLNDVLGCFYVHQSEIPSEPSFQIQNKSTPLQPKLINFDKQRFDKNDITNSSKKRQKKDQKPLKGILKMTPEERIRQRSESAPRKIDPALISLLKQMQINKNAYPKQRAEILLKPYKDSGQLDYLKNNPSILTNLMRSSSVPTEAERIATTVATGPLPNPYKRYSVSPQPQKPLMPYQPPQPPMGMEMNKPMPIQYNQYNQPQPGYGNNYGQYGYYPNYSGQITQPIPQAPNPGMMNIYPNSNQMYPAAQQPQPQPQQQQQQQNPYGGGGGYSQQNQQMYMMSRNYRTVPCKYFHSPQGCVKATNCTFIHEQEYAGKPTPSMLKSNRGMVMTSYTPNQPNMNMNMNMNDGNQMSNYYPYSPSDYQRPT